MMGSVNQNGNFHYTLVCYKVCNEIFSPLFFWTYIANVGYLFTRLFTALGADLKNSDPLVKVESIYAFLFLILIKILLPSYMGAILHERVLFQFNLFSLLGWLVGGVLTTGKRELKKQPKLQL